jgi:hypothetical protein
MALWSKRKRQEANNTRCDRRRVFNLEASDNLPGNLVQPKHIDHLDNLRTNAWSKVWKFRQAAVPKCPGSQRPVAVVAAY